MKYLSLCSGIDAASVAWEPLGWKAFGFSEIEAFPSAVLAHHWPDTPNLGDMTKFADWQNLHEVDLLVGGTPCQAFSLAGLRKSLDDARGNLTLTYVSILNKIDHERSIQLLPPAICVWENVPGVLNTKDNAFGCFLAALAGEDVPLVPSGGRWTNAGYVRGPQRTIAWRVIDAQYFGVAQRRRRVFVVASAREGFCPEQVLFEFEGMRRDTAPSREAGQAATGDTGTGFTPSSFGAYGEGVGTLRSTGGDLGGGSETLVTTQYGEIAGSLTARHDSSPCADRGQNMVAYGLPGNWIGRLPENGGNATEPMNDISPCLTKADKHAVAYGFNGNQSEKTRSMGEKEEQAPTLRADGPAHVAYAFDGYNQTLSDTSQTIRSDKSDGDHVGMVLTYSPPFANSLGVSPSTTTSPNVASGQGDVVVFDCYNQTCDPYVSKTVAARNDQDTASVVVHPPIGIDEEWNAKVEGFGTLKARMSGGGFQGSVMQPNLQVRRLTPVECHRLQGFSEWEKTIDIYIQDRKIIACLDHPKNPASVATKCHKLQNNVSLVEEKQFQQNAKSATRNFCINKEDQGRLVVVSVLINYVERTLQILNNKNELLFNARIAESSNKDQRASQIVDFVHLSAEIVSCLGQILLAGKEELPSCIYNFTKPKSGKPQKSEQKSGLEIHANAAVKKKWLESEVITLTTSQNISQTKTLDSKTKTSLYSVFHAIDGFIPEQIPATSGCLVRLITISDHCQIPWRGKPADQCPDGPQYKALGNSMAVPCMEWIGERIDNLLFGGFEI